MKRVSAFLLAMSMLVGISGCETMKGFGKDLEKLGDKIEDAANN